MSFVAPLMFLVLVAAPMTFVLVTAYMLDGRRGIVPAISLGIVAPIVTFMVLVTFTKTSLMPRSAIRDLLGIDGAIFVVSAIIALAPTAIYVLGHGAYQSYRARRKSIMELVLLATTTSCFCMALFYAIGFGNSLPLATVGVVVSIVLGIAITVDQVIRQ
ncbi:MAG: hypothetical protein AAGD43_33330 [Pseudomonadota bacterium]